MNPDTRTQKAQKFRRSRKKFQKKDQNFFGISSATSA
jgi:peroxiredoxin